jgi:hypothetical protein
MLFMHAVLACCPFFTLAILFQLFFLAPLQVQLMEEHIIRLSNRPGEAGKVRKTKQALKKQMEPPLSSLMSWRAGGYLGFDRLPEQVQQASGSVSAANGWTVGELEFGAVQDRGLQCSMQRVAVQHAAGCIAACTGWCQGGFESSSSWQRFFFLGVQRLNSEVLPVLPCR